MGHESANNLTRSYTGISKGFIPRLDQVVFLPVSVCWEESTSEFIQVVDYGSLNENVTHRLINLNA